MEIIVIGTNPPCPRCDLLGLIAEKAVSTLGLSVEVRHLFWNSAEAQALAEGLGRKLGTAHQVAEDVGFTMNSTAVAEAMMLKSDEVGENYRPAELWTPQLDEAMRPAAEQAEDNGWFMTPVLAINGKVVHHGSVPTEEEILQWLKEAE